MQKRLLTLDDLYVFYSNYQRSTHFSASENKSPIVVQVNGLIKFEEDSDDSKEGLVPVVLQSCHIDTNINKTNIKREVMEAALPSFSNRPILGYIHIVDDQPEFYGHNMTINSDGSVDYQEIPVGIIPESCNARLEYDEEKEKTYTVVNGYIYEEYSRAAEILRREKECACSVELSVRELSYNAKEKYLDIENFFFSGVTLLGKDDNGREIKPGMQGSNIRLSDFSEKNNSLFSNQKIIEMLENIQASIDIKNSKEGGTEKVKFDELLVKFGVTKDDITFEYESLSDEELEEKFVEIFGSTEEEDSGETSDEVEVTEVTVEETFEESGDDSGIAETPTSTKFTRDVNGFHIEYELSHEDVRYALYNLVAQYDELDNDWYYIRSVYDSHFVMEAWCSGKIYGQNYVKDGDNVSFEGERWELFAELLTATEKATLEEMRSNYSAIQSELENYRKADYAAQKKEILESEAYELVADSNEFKTLINDSEKYSVQEVQTKADSILLSYVKRSNFSATTPKNKPKNSVHIPFNNEEEDSRSPYGNLFAENK